MRKIYIAGKITGDPNYRQKFANAEAYLRSLADMTHSVRPVILNPGILPDGMEYEDYMTICFAMIDVADEVVFLWDWDQSPGAIREMTRCKQMGKNFSFLPPAVKNEKGSRSRALRRSC